MASGCRFGSRVEHQPNPDKITGFYSARPKSLTFFTTTSITIQKEASVDSIPDEIGKVMTNPVALKIDDLSTGSGRWISPVNGLALPVSVDPDLNLSLRGTTKLVTLWDDDNCKTYLEIAEGGKLIKSEGVEEIPGNTRPLSGKVQATFQVINQFKGDCVPTFQRMEICLHDVTQCGGRSSTENLSVQSDILNFFHPWLSSDAMTIADIPSLVNFAYEVTFE